MYGLQYGKLEGFPHNFPEGFTEYLIDSVSNGNFVDFFDDRTEGALASM